MENKFVKTTLDRDRIVLLHGDELFLSYYACGECGSSYYIQAIENSFCPICGIRYEYFEDVSV